MLEHCLSRLSTLVLHQNNENAIGHSQATEVKRILADHGATKGPSPEQPSLVSLTTIDIDLPEIQEVDTTAIAKDKAILAAKLVNGPCLVEDTSLEFDALGGMPGPYIKWFQDRLQSRGLYNILEAYPDQKSATAVCTLAFCPAPHADPVLFTGECRGTIVPPEQGLGFGWDSIFVPDDGAFSVKSGGGGVNQKRFSQMTTEEKCDVSHRGKVREEFVQYTIYPSFASVRTLPDVLLIFISPISPLSDEKAVRKWADWLGRNQEALWERQERKRLYGSSSSTSMLTNPILGHQGLVFKADEEEGKIQQ